MIKTYGSVLGRDSLPKDRKVEKASHRSTVWFKKVQIRFKNCYINATFLCFYLYIRQKEKHDNIHQPNCCTEMNLEKDIKENTHYRVRDACFL